MRGATELVMSSRCVWFNGSAAIRKSTQNGPGWMSPDDSPIAALTSQLQYLVNCRRVDIAESQGQYKKQLDGTDNIVLVFLQSIECDLPTLLAVSPTKSQSGALGEGIDAVHSRGFGVGGHAHLLPFSFRRRTWAVK